MNAAPPALHIEGAVATITLRRPRQANRLTPDDVGVLLEHLTTVNAASQVLVLRFMAVGRYFCSVYDVASLGGKNGARGSLYFGDAMDVLERVRPVTIAVIQGGVYGGATDLCLACDFRIGVETADMFMPPVRLGLHIYPGAMQRYVSRLGLNVAKRLLLTAKTIDARTMLDWGVLTHLVAPDALQEATQTLTDTLTGMAPLALLGMKRSLVDLACGEWDTERVCAEVVSTEQSHDLHEGVQAWKERRAPRFSGK